MKKCIVDFQEAGVKTWIVTGDKNSTAKSIGFTSGVFNPHRSIIQIDDIATSDSDRKQLIASLADGHSDLLISGKAICSLVESDLSTDRLKAIVDSFMKVQGLVVFRASPSEKAKLVRLVRTNRPDITTLAIGDGANDVNMIQQAHVGIGIIGKEGT